MLTSRYETQGFGGPLEWVDGAVFLFWRSIHLVLWRLGEGPHRSLACRQNLFWNSPYLRLSLNKEPSCSKEVGRRATLKDSAFSSSTHNSPPVMEAEVTVAVEVHRIKALLCMKQC